MAAHCLLVNAGLSVPKGNRPLLPTLGTCPSTGMAGMPQVNSPREVDNIAEIFQLLIKRIIQ